MNARFFGSVAVAFACSALSLGCSVASTDASADAVDAVDAEETSALRVTGAVITSTYEGVLVIGDVSHTVRLEVSLPESAIASQSVESSKFHLSSFGNCRAYTDSVPVSSRVTVTREGGEVLVDETSSSFSSPKSNLPASACPTGILVRPAAETDLEIAIARPGVKFASEQGEVHVTRGAWGILGNVSLFGRATYEPLSRPTFRSSDNGAYRSSVLKVAQGTLRFSLPESREISVGIGLQPNGTFDAIQNVTLTRVDAPKAL
jgi:hypothetical protein